MLQPSDEVSEESHLIWMLRQTVDELVQKQVEAKAKEMVADQLQELEEFQNKLEQIQRSLVDLLTVVSQTLGGAGFYAVSVVLALFIGGIVAINVPHTVVCSEVDPICPLRVKGRTVDLEDIQD
ncbi:hypothetical protein [Lyngbya confervoides]|uniref:Uncharacterized protein n=1 Tax=Lyngbya confervoides BDU141951 TaxID=1574623 RepID=A0ABD4T720_9CYAN|nr:hypothetical protein [Lyngbya confervoides]MCM1984436.1 hypothetical protein [Lyngbya confervoides BDU141951]